MYWPGRKPSLVCVEHAAVAKRVAEAMGFHLVVEPLPVIAEVMQAIKDAMAQRE
jgi:hypothetical protein